MRGKGSSGQTSVAGAGAYEYDGGRLERDSQPSHGNGRDGDGLMMLVSAAAAS